MLVACWWARLMVESTDTSQSTSQSSSPAASALASRWVWIRSHVPSALKRRCRFHTVCHGPNDSGTSRQGRPAR